MSRRPRPRTMVDPAAAVALIKPLTHRQLCGVAFFSGVTLFTLHGLRAGKYIKCQSYTLAAIRRGVELIKGAIK
jgi:hypothetical protein